MNILSGSIDGPAFGSAASPGGGDRPEGPDDRDAPSPETAKELYDDAMCTARRRLLLVLPASVVVAALAYVMAYDPAYFWILAVPTLALAGMAFRLAREWWRLRSVDPLESWHRERREEWLHSQALVEHQSRMLAVTPFVSYSLGAVVAAVTCVQFLGPGVESSIELAALVKPAVRAGEWWRLLSAPLLHASLWHLIGNLSVLVALGALIEAYGRRAHVPLAFLAGAIGGSFASTLMVWEAASVGASGGVLGLLGFLLVTGVGSATSRTLLRKQLVIMLMMTAGTGLVGFFFIDNAAHAGGVVTGFCAGAVATGADRTGGKWPSRFNAAGYASGAILLVGAVFTIGRLLASW
jgi:membrane associated rhomboid family serine protease